MQVSLNEVRQVLAIRMKEMVQVGQNLSRVKGVIVRMWVVMQGSPGWVRQVQISKGCSSNPLVGSVISLRDDEIVGLLRLAVDNSNSHR